MALTPEQIRDVAQKSLQAREQKRFAKTPEQEKQAVELARSAMRLRAAKQRGYL